MKHNRKKFHCDNNHLAVLRRKCFSVRPDLFPYSKPFEFVFSDSLFDILSSVFFSYLAR